MHCFRYIIAILLLIVQTITFAQGVGVDSMQMVNALADTCFNNTIADSVKLKSVPFETIAREGTKYYAVTSDGHKEEITSFINDQKRVMVKDGDGHELVIDKDGNVMGVEEYTKCGRSKALLRESIKEKDSHTTINELRQDLAVLEQWKRVEDIPTCVKYRVTKELPVRNGVVGPQIDSYAEETIYFDIFVSYKGGNQQYEIVLPKEVNWRGEDWEDYLIELERLELK